MSLIKSELIVLRVLTKLLIAQEKQTEEWMGKALPKKGSKKSTLEANPKCNLGINIQPKPAISAKK